MTGPTDRIGENGGRVDARVAESQMNDDAAADELSDDAFDAYLQRGSTVSQSYRAIEHEAPPAQLDATILSRAQAELRTNTSQKYRHWKKWTVPVALAASTVMAISIVLESGMQHEVRSVASDEILQRERRLTSEPAREAAGPEAVERPAFASTPNAESDFALAPSEPNASRAAPVETAAEQEQFFALDAPSPAPPQANVSRDALAARAARDAEEKQAQVQRASEMREVNAARAQSAKRSESPLQPVPGRPEPTQSVSAGQPVTRVMPEQIQTQASRREPTAWLDAIRELRKAGKDEAADREWRAFKAAYADFEVAADDTARPVNERD